MNIWGGVLSLPLFALLGFLCRLEVVGHHLPNRSHAHMSQIVMTDVLGFHAYLTFGYFKGPDVALLFGAVMQPYLNASAACEAQLCRGFLL